MRQSWAMRAAVLLLMAGCDAHKPAANAAGIVSLTPAGTDLLLAMNLGPEIVGISSYEPNEDLRRRLPKLGDYFRIDFERLAELRPKFIVIQGKHDRMPGGTRERCQMLGVAPIILQINQLADIKTALTQIGDATGHADAARRAVDAMEDAERKLAAARPADAVAAVMVFGDGGTNVIGVDNFLNDALDLAGGRNVVTASGYPSYDAEKMRSVAPAIVFLLLPNADDAAVRRAIATLPSNLTSKRVVPITDANVLVPGTNVTHTAETMAAAMRAGTPPATSPSDPSRAGG